MGINYIKNRIISLKSLSVIAFLIFILLLIIIPLLNVGAETVNISPSFSIELNSDKKVANVGDEITVNGKIIPNDFEKEIADTISNSYDSDNINIDLKLPDNFTKNDISYFTSNDGGKNLQPISENVVKYVGEENSTKTKMIYKAEPIYFSFKIIGNEVGKFKLFGSDFLSKIDLNFKDLKNGTCSTTIPELDITLNDKLLPQIYADLNDSYLSKSYSVGDAMDITYTIKPQPFKYEGDETGVQDSNAPKDVVFLIDTSKLMENKLVDLARAIKNKIILNKNKDRFSIITYDSSFVYHKLDDYKSLSEVNNFVNNGESNYSNAIASMLETIASNKANELKNINSSTDKLDLSAALTQAQDILENGREEDITKKIDEGRAAATKNIVIIGAANIDFNSQLDNEISNIQQKNYNIITLNIGDVNKGLKQPDNNLRDLHYKLTNNMVNSAFISFLKDTEKKYYINIDYRKLGQISDDKLLEDANNYNQNSWIEDPVMVRINNDLLNGKLKQKPNTYSFSPKLKFNVGKDFSIVPGLKKSETSGYDYETDSFTVTYTLQSDGSYTAPESTVSFKISPNSIGNLKFDTPNHIVYFGIENEEIKNSINTPIIVDKTLPMIDAEVIDPPTQVKLGDEINLKYKIKPQEFDQNAIPNDFVGKDVVFAFDIAKTAKSNGKGNWADEDTKVQQVKQALIDKLTKELDVKNAKYGIVTYSNPSEVSSSQNLMEPNELADKIKNISQSNKGGSKVSAGEGKALKILGNYSENNHAKYIIIISSGKANAKNHLGLEYSTVDNAVIGKYNRITLDLSDNAQPINERVNLIFDKIRNARILSYTFNTKLKFHTEGNFSAVYDQNKSSDSWYDVGTSEFYVKYNLDEESGKYVPEEQNKIVELTIKPRAIGTFQFGDSSSENSRENKYPGAVSYENLTGQLKYNKINPCSIQVVNNELPPLPDLF